METLYMIVDVVVITLIIVGGLFEIMARNDVK